MFIIILSAPFFKCISISDIFLIPTRPIELLAYALAVEERGEDGAFNPATAYALGQTALTDSISLDAGKHPEETVWSVS